MTAGRQINSQSVDWCTPPKYVKAVEEYFDGRIDLDPCSNKWSIVKAKVKYSLPAHDGLTSSWNFEHIYVNPPYGSDKVRRTSIKHWLAKCAEANEAYKSEVLALIPVATNTSHWKEYVWGKASGVCFLSDTRLRFLVNGKDEGKGAPMSCAIVLWGDRFEDFENIFKEYGAVVDIRNMQLGSRVIQLQTKLF